MEGQEERRGREPPPATDVTDAAPDMLASLKKIVLEEAECGAGLSVWPGDAGRGTWCGCT